MGIKKMKIGDLEKISGIPRSTIHHYINFGLLHQPVKTGQTMAYYDTGHVKRLEAIQKIKVNYLKTAKTSRIPLDHIKNKLREDYSLVKSQSRRSLKSIDGGTTKRSRKKEQIIQATLKLYANRGYYLTNIRDVARAVGISSPTFYRYFKDKRELFVETTEYVVKSFKREMKQKLKGEKDLAVRSTIMFEIFFEHYGSIGEILSQLRSGAVIGDPWARSSLSKLYAEMMEHLVFEFKMAIQNGTIRPVNPYLLAFFSLAIDESAILLASMEDHLSIDEIMSFVGDMLNTSFLTPRGQKGGDVFYKPRSRRHETSRTSPEDPD